MALTPSRGPAAMHQTEITHAQFEDFVDATGYVTLAERADPDQPGVALGSAVFRTPTPASPQWWHLDRTASWRQPDGASSRAARPDEPVRHIAYPDARAYADWLGGRLPSLQEWRRAALGDEAWDALTAPPNTANTWQGPFPVHDAARDGYDGIAPVGHYPPNAFGLHDMVGNAWEWTSTPAGPNEGRIAGGSFLCDVDLCRNGTPFGQQVQDRDFSASHIGFRLVFDEWPQECGP